MGLSTKSLAGPGYVILNCIRVCNIICLLAVIVASMTMLVKTLKTSQFYFFDGVSHIITVFVSIFLIISEVSLFRHYFARHWPLLSPSHGFVALGLSMLVIGVNILGNLNKHATSQKNLGMAFWRIVIASGVLVLIFGFLNIIASYVFRDRDRHITARQVRAKGAVAMSQQDEEVAAKSYSFDAPSTDRPHTPVTTYTTPAYPVTPPQQQPQQEKKSAWRFTMFGRKPTLPSYHTSPVPSSRYSPRSQTHERAMEISAPLNVNPQFAHLVRPDSAYHPSRAVGR